MTYTAQELEDISTLTQDAYSRNRYGEKHWKNMTIKLGKEGYTKEETQWILMSKYPRWAADYANDNVSGKSIINYKEKYGIDIEKADLKEIKKMFKKLESDRKDLIGNNQNNQLEEAIVINKNISEYGLSFSIIKDGRIALSELTFMDQSQALGYMDLANNDGDKERYKTVIKNADKCVFYNRLNVPENLRKQGLGSMLLQETINYCKENDIAIINTANEYGQMGQKNLLNFYKKHGMQLVHKEGLFLYHSSLDVNLNNVKKFKF